jgi:hypothetical protein
MIPYETYLPRFELSHCLSYSISAPDPKGSVAQIEPADLVRLTPPSFGSQESCLPAPERGP